MKRIVYYCGNLLTLLVFVGPIFILHDIHGKSLSTPGEQSPFHDNGVPTERLKSVFANLGVSIETLEQANAFAQKNFIRTGERWDKQADTEVNQKIRMEEALLRKDLEALGMIAEIAPTQKTYAYALLMGALKERVVARLAYLAELEQQGHCFGTVVLLGGGRPLRSEEKDGLPEGITTESQMMQYLYEQSKKPADQKVLVVNVPMVQKEGGALARPITDGTLAHFAEIAPEPGTCLVISNNPYVVRQTKVAQRILDQLRFPAEGAGKAVKADSGDIVILMDEFARTLYEYYKQAQS